MCEPATVAAGVLSDFSPHAATVPSPEIRGNHFVQNSPLALKRPLLRLAVAVLLLLLTDRSCIRADEQDPVQAESPSTLRGEACGTRTGDVTLTIAVSGTMTTPVTQGTQSWTLRSDGSAVFSQRAFVENSPAPQALRAVRRFRSATSQISVGDQHTDELALSPQYREIHVFGTSTGLKHRSSAIPLTPRQLELLQMPFDPLVAVALLPSKPVTAGTEYTPEPWVISAAAGLDAVVEKNVTCRVASMTEDAAEIEFSGTMDGAVTGSSTKASVTGRFRFDRASGIVTQMRGELTEERTPGPVSPGLNVRVTVAWSQTTGTDDSGKGLPEEAPPFPSDDQFELAVPTPIRAELRFSRQWHLFHETGELIMLRMLRNGGLVAQCNITTGTTMPAGQHTSDAEFRSDVEAAVGPRGGRVLSEETIRDDRKWRVRHVAATGPEREKPVYWDYYLCSAADGHQLSLVFSHSEDSEEGFREESQRVLNSLQMPQRRTGLPYP